MHTKAKNNPIFKKLIIAFLVVALSVSTFFVVCLLTKDKSNLGNSATAEASAVSVSNLNELIAKTNEGRSRIKVVADFEITEPVYIPYKTEIFCDETHTLKRAQDYLGDMFVVGTNKDGLNPNVVNVQPSLTLTGNKTTGASLIIDGNSQGITDTVKGSAVFIVNTARFNMHENAVIQNCKKLGNERTENYIMSKTAEAGGSAVMVTSGTFNMLGGTIKNCEVSLDEETSTNPNKISTMGGAVYSFGTVYINGGTITECKAARGGAIYNYKRTKVEAGTFSKNYATVYGGVVYNPNSQYSTFYVGNYTNEDKVVFSENTCDGSGGVVFSSIKASVLLVGAKFEKNTADSNGGVLNSPGANVIKNSKFIENTAGSKGGGIYVYHNDAILTRRETVIENTTFTSNEATSGGGAVGAGSSVDDLSYLGSKVIIKGCNFITNKAKQGGAVYVIRGCTVNIENCLIEQNTSSDNGGGLYFTGSSNITVNNCEVTKNIATEDGGGAYCTGSSNIKFINCDITSNSAKGGGGAYLTSSVVANIENCDISKNTATSNGAGLYIYTSVNLNLDDCVLSQNISNNYGGGIYASGKGTTVIRNIKANQNSAPKGGFLYLTTSGTTVKIISGEALDNIATETDGGSTIWTNSASVTLQIKGLETKEFFNYNGEIKLKTGGAITEYEA